jgi:NitT/TauT family transport system substrate-binding protein
MKKIWKSAAIAAILALTAVLGLAACGDNTSDGEAPLNRAVKISYAPTAFCQAPLGIAEWQGFFEAEGIETEFINYGTDSQAVRAALQSGGVDAAAGMVAEFLVPISNGLNLTFTTGLHTGCSSVFINTSRAQVKDLADAHEGLTFIPYLKTALGRNVSIGVVPVGGPQQNIGYRFLDADGVSLDDVDFVSGVDNPTLLQRLVQNDVDLIIAGDQLGEKYIVGSAGESIEANTLTRVRSLQFDADFADESCCVLGFGAAFYNAYPSVAEKVSRAVYKAAKWLDKNEANRAAAVTLLTQNNYLPVGAEYAVHLYGLYTWGVSNAVVEQTLYNSVDEYKALGLLAATANVADIKDLIWKPFDFSNITV